MWLWVQENAEAITAVVAVLGFILAALLGYLAIRVASRAHKADVTARGDAALLVILDRTTKFMEVASLPYWTEPIPSDGSPEDLQHHQAAAELQTALWTYGELQLDMVASEMFEHLIACRAFYHAAGSWATELRGQPYSRFGAVLTTYLAEQGLDDARASALTNQLTEGLRRLYEEPPGDLLDRVSVMQQAVHLFEITRRNLISAYSERTR